MNMYNNGDIVKVNDGVFEDLFGMVVDTEELKDGCYITLLGEEDPMYFEFNEIEKAKPKEYFEAMIKMAEAREVPYLYVMVKFPNLNDIELVISPLTNFEKKLEFYLENYDDELNYKHMNGIKIVGYGVSECLDFIEEAVYGED